MTRKRYFKLHDFFTNDTYELLNIIYNYIYTYICVCVCMYLVLYLWLKIIAFDVFNITVNLLLYFTY